MTPVAIPLESSRFEFDALAQARNYRRALIQEFRPNLNGAVIEIGAGIGQMTEELLRISSIKRLVAIEPEARFCDEHRRRVSGCELIQGVITKADAGANWDGIFSVNVLEHIEDDVGELKVYASLLRAAKGRLCLFVPASPEIYAPIDRDFGHFRRYTKSTLGKKLREAGFVILRLDYFNFIGYFAWWVNFVVLKRRRFETAKVRAFDRILFPFFFTLESKILRPPFGQSLIAVAQARR